LTIKHIIFIAKLKKFLLTPGRGYFTVKKVEENQKCSPAGTGTRIFILAIIILPGQECASTFKRM
jgi:hypothetical protein